MMSTTVFDYQIISYSKLFLIYKKASSFTTSVKVTFPLSSENNKFVFQGRLRNSTLRSKSIFALMF